MIFKLIHFLLWCHRQSQCELRNLYRPMVVTQPISSLAPKLLGPPAGQRHHSSESSSSGPSVLLVLMGSVNPTPCLPGFLLHTGPVMGIIFTAFVMGVGLMGALWCIYNHTGERT